MKRLIVATLATSLLFACGDTTDDKGAEENELTGGKDDSFFRPTEHGALRMGIANPARMTNDEQFHAWTFELSGDAEIELHTEVSQNLDTVMYLYHRTSPDDSWGRFKRKNDDDAGKVSSRIKHEGVAGEYRVIVKGFKAALRGSFSVHGACTGDGCVQSDNSCDVDEFQSLPTFTQWTPSCAFEIAGMLDGAPVSTSGGEVGLLEKCALSGVELKGIDYYVGFWDEIVGFEDQFRDDPDEDIFLNFHVERYRGGTVVSVDAGGDEDGLSMYFDNDEKLLAAYQHNQSPTVEFFCGDSTEAPIPGPTEDCFQLLTWSLPHDDETARTFNDVVVGEAANEPPGIAVAVTRFASQADLADDDVVTTEVITWTSTEGIDVVETNIIGPDDVSAQYTAANERGDFEIILEVDANGATVVCE